MDVAANFTIQLHVPFGGHVADDGKVLADDRFPHSTHTLTTNFKKHKTTLRGGPAAMLPGSMVAGAGSAPQLCACKLFWRSVYRKQFPHKLGESERGELLCRYNELAIAPRRS
jgi:hypothetical protein